MFERLQQTYAGLVYKYPERQIENPEQYMVDFVSDDFKKKAGGIEFQPGISVCGFLKYLSKL